MKRVLTLLVALAVSTAFAAPASAATILFNNAALNTGGTVTFGGATATVVSAPIDLVSRILPGGPVPLAVTAFGPGCGTFLSGCVNVTTGPLLGPPTTLAGVTTWNYSSTGSSVTITGTTTNGSGLLLSDTFAGIITVTSSPSNGSIQGALNGGTLNAALASYFSVSPVSISGVGSDQFLNLTFNSTSGGTGTGTQNQFQVQTELVPEPGTMLLFGTGLVGLARLGRRRFFKG